MIGRALVGVGSTGLGRFFQFHRRSFSEFCGTEIHAAVQENRCLDKGFGAVRTPDLLITKQTTIWVAVHVNGKRASHPTLTVV